MKYLLLSFILFISCSNNDNEKQLHQIAKKEFEKHLQNIERYLENPNYDSSMPQTHSTSELESITGIQSESEGTFFGKMNPTSKDLKKWKQWYELNKDKLTRDEENNQIKIDTK